MFKVSYEYLMRLEDLNFKIGYESGEGLSLEVARKSAESKIRTKLFEWRRDFPNAAIIQMSATPKVTIISSLSETENS